MPEIFSRIMFGGSLSIYIFVGWGMAMILIQNFKKK